MQCEKTKPTTTISGTNSTPSSMFVDIEPAEEALNDREWHRHLESLLTIGEVNPDILPFLDHRQQWCINEIKKTFARIKYRERRLGENPDNE